MAKTDITLSIEKSLLCYAPKELGGIVLNTARGTFIAFEVPVKCGTTLSGMIDCVKVSEYFGDKKRIGVCRCYTWKRDRIRKMRIDCLNGILYSDNTPEFCNNINCYWNIKRDVGVPKVLITCFEIKINKADFHSKNGHNFVGNLNYYVVPAELYEVIKKDISSEVGVILYKNGNLRKKRDAIFVPMTDEDQKWMILNVLKRINRIK